MESFWFTLISRGEEPNYPFFLAYICINVLNVNTFSTMKAPFLSLQSYHRLTRTQKSYYFFFLQLYFFLFLNFSWKINRAIRANPKFWACIKHISRFSCFRLLVSVPVFPCVTPAYLRAAKKRRPTDTNRSIPQWLRGRKKKNPLSFLVWKLQRGD